MGHVVAVGILYEYPVRVIVIKILIEAVVLAQAYVVHILVLLDAGGAQVHVVHQAGVVVAGGDAVPGLAGVLKVAYVAVAYQEVVARGPHQACVVAAGLTLGAVHESIGHSGVECAVYDELVVEQVAGRERAAQPAGVE